MLGLDGAGKTAIYNKLCEIDKPLKPTGGFNTKKLTVNDVFKIDLWEIGGAEKIRPYWKKYLKNIDGIVFVVDTSEASNADRFALVK